MLLLKTMNQPRVQPWWLDMPTTRIKWMGQLNRLRTRLSWRLTQRDTNNKMFLQHTENWITTQARQSLKPMANS